VSCLFCKIGSGELGSNTIYEDDDVRAFLDINPLTLGHTVVIPKKHVENILDLEDKLVGPVFLGVKKATQILTDKLGVEDFTIGINHGRMHGHPDIVHMHVHVIPRYDDDGGGDIHSIVSQVFDDSVEEVYNKIMGDNK